MTPLKAFRPLVLEVERKFRSLAVAELTQHGGIPPFQSLQSHPVKKIQDIYYDRDNTLSSAGVWVRLRNGAWQAKVRKGGDLLNSRFEELYEARDISANVRRITGDNVSDSSNNFGLLPMAKFLTTRQTWVADREFRIVLDTMDFGHEVGEVELEMEFPRTQDWTEAQKTRVMEEMDGRIRAFMEKYAWAFSPGKPTGKLTAFFEQARDVNST